MFYCSIVLNQEVITERYDKMLESVITSMKLVFTEKKTNLSKEKETLY